MANNKLGLKIVRYYNGASSILGVNEQPLWVEHTSDTRSILKSIDNIEGATEPILILKNIDGGSIIAIATLIGGRPEDCITAWLYIPACVRINGKQIADVISHIKSEILASRIDEERLENLFKQEYELLPTRKIIYAARGEKDAFRYYGTGCYFNLNETLEELNQPYYKDYNYIFILDKASGLVCRGDDLTGRSMISTVLIQPPTPVDEFYPYVDEKRFNSPIYLAEGSDLRIEWRREGFKPIIKHAKVQKAGLEVSAPARNEWYCVITYDNFAVFDTETRQRISDYTLYVNNNRLNPGCTTSVPYNIITNVPIRVECENYQKYEKPNDLQEIVRKTSKTYKISLERKHYSYKLRLDEVGREFSFETKNKLKKSPIPGYITEYFDHSEKDGYVLHLRYQPYNVKKLVVTIAIWTIIVFALGGSLGYRYSSKHNSTSNPTTPKEEQEPPVLVGNHNENEVPEINIWDTIVEYLEEHNVWNKEDMNAYSEIQGLWDAINEYKFDDILKYKDDLEKSERFMCLVKAIEENSEKRHLHKYCDQPDTQITIDRYIKKLKEDRMVSVKPPQSQKGSGNDHVDDM